MNEQPRCQECGRPILEGDAHEQYEDGLVCADCNAAYDLGPDDVSSYQGEDYDFLDF